MRLIQALAIAWRTQADVLSTPTTNRQYEVLERAIVTTLMEDGRLTVQMDGEELVAVPVTDEPFEVNMRVWVSRTKEGVIVHGSIK